MPPHNVLQQLRALDYGHKWTTAPDHICDIYQYAKDYAGETAVEIGSFYGHGTLALHLAKLKVKACDPDKSTLPVRQAACPDAEFVNCTGQQELENPTQYAVVFHDSYHGNRVIPELVGYWNKKIIVGGLLIVHDVDQLNMARFLGNIGNPVHRITFDKLGRGLGFFWKNY